MLYRGTPEYIGVNRDFGKDHGNYSGPKPSTLNPISIVAAFGKEMVQG